jgi:hypothetical protein
LARWRVPPVASGQPCRSARRSCRGQAGAPPAAWHALGAAAAHPQRRQVAPRRAVSAPCHRAGAPGAPMLRHRRSPPADRTAARRKQSWPDPLRRRQESPAKRHHATAPVQGSERWERNVLPGQGILGPSWHTPSASHASNPALCRDQITADGQALRAAALLYLAAVKARERWAQDFEFTCLTWGGAKGFEPLTSCMPSAGSTSTAVRLCRSPSQGVRSRLLRSAPVAVLSRCTGRRAGQVPDGLLASQNLQGLYRGASQGDQDPMALHESSKVGRGSHGHCLSPPPPTRVRTTGHSRVPAGHQSSVTPCFG